MIEEEMLVKQGFSADQIREIKEGQEAGLDVSVYAKKEYMAIQMRQIRMGMAEGLPVELYADTDFDWFQMEEIRNGLAAGLNTGIYAKPEIPYDKMRQIRKGLLKGIDLTPYLYLEAGVLKELRKALIARINIVEYINQGYEKEQLREIRHALQKKLDIGKYLCKDYRGASICEIANGLEKGLDVSVYAVPEFGWQQMREIRLGLENRVDISVYARPLYSWQQMKEIRLGLESGLDVGAYKSLMYTAKDMEKARLKLMEEAEKKEEEQEEKRTAKESEVLKTDRFIITLSGDEMEAHIVVPEGVGKISRQAVYDALKQKGITRGICESGITELVSGEEANKKILIAKGAQAQDGKDGYYEFFFKTQVDKTPKLLPDGSVDYQSIEWFVMVETGQKLAYYHSAEEGVCGYTVTGKILSCRRGKEKSALAGKGFILEKDGKTYVSAVKGKVELEGQRLEVSRLLVIDEITLATGNISFDGSIYIRGNVGTGTVITATEDIMIDGFVEGSTIKSGKSILLRQGVNASGNGSITAAKDINGRFFEAVKVYADGNIQANYCLNCELYAQGQITISGSKGTLAGGAITAVKGLFAYNVGNRAGIPTYIKIGINENIIQNGMMIENKMKEVNKELNILGNAYTDFQRKYPPEVRNTMEMYLKIESAIYTKEKELEKLYKAKARQDEAIDKIGCARAIIRGSLFEGIVIEIDRRRWISAGVSNVTIRRVNDRIAVFSN